MNGTRYPSCHKSTWIYLHGVVFYSITKRNPFVILNRRGHKQHIMQIAIAKNEYKGERKSHFALDLDAIHFSILIVRSHEPADPKSAGTEKCRNHVRLHIHQIGRIIFRRGFQSRLVTHVPGELSARPNWFTHCFEKNQFSLSWVENFRRLFVGLPAWLNSNILITEVFLIDSAWGKLIRWRSEVVELRLPVAQLGSFSSPEGEAESVTSDEIYCTIGLSISPSAETIFINFNSNSLKLLAWEDRQRIVYTASSIDLPCRGSFEHLIRLIMHREVEMFFSERRSGVEAALTFPGTADNIQRWAA